MSLKELAQTVQAQGRGDDTVLVHMTKDEVAGLQALAQANGGSLTINPETGLPEAGFLSSILPMAAGAAAMFIPGLQGVGLYLMAAGMGAATALATAEDGESAGSAILRGALGGVGGAGLGGLAAGAAGGASAAAGAGAAEAGGLAATEAAGSALGTGAAEALGAGAADAAMAGTGAEAAMAGLTEADAIAALATDSVAPTVGAEVTGAELVSAESALAVPEGTAIGADVLAPTPEVVPYSGPTGGITAGGQAAPTPGGFGELTANAPRSGYGLTANGSNTPLGQVTATPATGSTSNGLGSAPGYSEVVAEAPTSGTGLSKDAQLAQPTNWKERMEKGLKLAQQANKMLGGGGGGGQTMGVPGAPGYNPPNGVGSSPLAPGFAGRWNSGANQYGAPGTTREQQMQKRRPAYEQARWFAEGGAVGMETGGFVVPADVVSALGSGSTDAGLRALAQVGAQPIKGPGDGQSDDIPATIDGEPRARVADGEAYLPPQVVASMGGGSHSAGAKRLYRMLDEVRRQAYGRPEQARPVDLDDALT